MGLFSKIGKALSGAVKSVGNVVKSVANTTLNIAQQAGPLAALIPGVGPIVALGTSVATGILGSSPPKQVAPGVFSAAPAQAPAAAALGLGPLAGLALGLFLLMKSK